MGSDFGRKCQVESRRVIWVVAAVLASVLVVQYFNVDRVLSLFPMRESYFDMKDTRAGTNRSSPSNTWLPSTLEGSVLKENPLLGNLPDIEHTEEEDDIVRATNVVPQKSSNTSLENRTAPAPNKAYTQDIVDGRTVSLGVAMAPFEAGDGRYAVSTSNSTAALVSESETDEHVGALVAANGNRTSRNESNEKLNSPNAANKNGTSMNESSDKLNRSVASTENGTSRNESSEKLSSSVAIPNVTSSTNSTPPTEKPKSPSVPSVASISDMNNMLLASRVLPYMETPLWSSAADQELLDARFRIEHAPIVTNHPTLHARIYRNLTTFLKSCEIMEEKLKVYVYENGRKPVFHNPKLRGIYASEGWFMKHMEASSQFVTRNPEEAHLFYLPFGSQRLVDYVYVKDSHSFDDINKFLKNYIETIKIRHAFWNRTDGADHFLVGCHDWATYETKQLMAKCIRALCNSDIKEGFKFGKDVALPETNIRTPQNPMRVTGGRPPSKRTTLAFFAGKMHGNVRQILIKHWRNKDPDVKISGPIKKNYMWYMQNSKYCICAKGYEVNSPRVVEAILYGCVPVILSDNFVPPFFDILNWETFAVFILEKDIPNIKDVLVSISETRYAVMQRRVLHVRQHFLWHNKPQRYDIFHMILHSIWYNRVFRTVM